VLVDLFGVIAPILIMVAIGFVIERRGVTLDTETLGLLVMLVGTPSLVFSSLTTADIPLEAIKRITLSASLVVLAAGLMTLAVLKLARLDVRAFLPAVTMPNSGNLGLPLVFFAFGSEGLAIGVAYFFVIAIIQYTVMAAIIAGDFRLGRLLREPLIYSVIAVIAFKMTGVQPPQVVADTTRILGGMMIPVMVVLLGISLAGLKVTDLPLSIGLAVLRLVIGCISGLLIVAALGLTGVEAGSVFLMASMPTAIVTYVFALRYGNAPRRVAGLVVISTVLTFCVLPGLLWLALRIKEVPTLAALVFG
jgi:hypothetical protein